MLYITKTVQIYFSDVFEDKLIKVENGEFHNFIATIVINYLPGIS